MGVLDWFRASPAPLMERHTGDGGTHTAEDKVDRIVADIWRKRRGAFGIEAARSIPAVARARDLLASTAASFLPLAYRNGQAMPTQPRIVTNPEAYGTRYSFIEQTMYSLIDHGCAPWRVYGRNEDPSRSAVVLPHGEMQAEWARRPFTRTFRWNGQVLGDGELHHIDIGRSAGELHGHGPLGRSLDMLYPVWEAEQYASSFFVSGGLPDVVLKVANELTGEEAEDLRNKWASTLFPHIRVASGGAVPEFPNVNPQQAQLQEARAYGATIAATIFGIPAALLHVQTSGATITYTNPAGAVEEMVKSTIAPRYLVPIEAAWSQLLASTQSVRFDLADMQRTDIKARFDLYAIGIDKGLLSVAEARSFEGWGPTDSVDEAVHQFDPVEPAPEPSIPAAEVLS